MAGSGYREPPSLARRGDGQTFQLTPLLYLVLGGGRRPAVLRRDRRAGQRALRQHRHAATTCAPWSTSSCVPSVCSPRPDGTQPEVQEVQPAAGAAVQVRRHRPRAHPPGHRTVRAAVQPGRRRPGDGWPSWRSAGGCCSDKGLAVGDLSGVRQARPAPAGRRGHRPVGRLPRVRPRRRRPPRRRDARASWAPGSTWSGRRSSPTSPTPTGWAAAVGCAPTSAGCTSTRSSRSRSPGSGGRTQYDALLLVVATQILQMVHQLTPLVRFDGYHVLADLTGVPDLFQRISPTLLGAAAVALAAPRGARCSSPGRGRWSRSGCSSSCRCCCSRCSRWCSRSRVCSARPGPALSEQATLLGRAWGDGDLLEVAARAIADASRSSSRSWRPL